MLFVIFCMFIGMRERVKLWWYGSTCIGRRVKRKRVKELCGQRGSRCTHSVIWDLAYFNHTIIRSDPIKSPHRVSKDNFISWQMSSAWHAPNKGLYTVSCTIYACGLYSSNWPLAMVSTNTSNNELFHCTVVGCNVYFCDGPLIIVFHFLSQWKIL